MTDIIEDYLRELEHRLQADAERKRQIVSEIRSHLRERVYEVQNADPARSQEDVAREVIAEFGNPHDLALAYAPGGAPVLKSASTGEVVMRFGRAVGRGTKAFLKGVAITLVVLLLVAGAVGAWAYYEFKPVVAANLPYEVYEANEECLAANCTATVLTRQFFVHADAREVRLRVDLARLVGMTYYSPGGSYTTQRGDGEPYLVRDRERVEGPFGGVNVTVRDAKGAIAYARAFTVDDPRDVHEEITWAPVTGNWTVEYRLEGFRGEWHLSVNAIGLPRDAVVRPADVF